MPVESVELPDPLLPVEPDPPVLDGALLLLFSLVLLDLVLLFVELEPEPPVLIESELLEPEPLVVDPELPEPVVEPD